MYRSHLVQSLLHLYPLALIVPLSAGCAAEPTCHDLRNCPLDRDAERTNDAFVSEDGHFDTGPGADRGPTDGADAGGPTDDAIRPDGTTGARDATVERDASTSCDRDCRGGPCVDGRCQPVKLGSLPNTNVTDLAVDSSNIYWLWETWDVKQRGISKCPISGCGNSSPTELWTGPGTTVNDRRFAVDAQFLYWTSREDKTLLSCGLSGCNHVPSVLISNEIIFSAAVSGPILSWINVSGEVVRCASSSCAATRTPLVTGAMSLDSIFADQLNVYYDDGGALKKCAIAGCSNAPSTIVHDRAGSVRSDGESIYWIHGSSYVLATNSYASDGSVKTCSIAGCNDSPTVLASGLTGPQGLTIDDSALYWWAADLTGPGTVTTALKDGSHVRSLAEGQKSPLVARVVVDANLVYWGAGDAIMKVAK